MCGRYRMTTHPMVPELFAKLGVTLPLDGFVPRWNIAPMQWASLLVADEAGARLDVARWGFVPAYERAARPKLRPINAKAETLATSGFYRAAFAQRRALVPATGFYEWEAEGKARRPFLFEAAGGAPFAFAAVWSRWRPDGAPAEATFAIVTAPSGPPVSRFHDRTPVVVPAEQYEVWLGGAPDAALALLHAPPAEFFRERRVSSFVGSVHHEGPECDAPPEAE